MSNHILSRNQSIAWVLTATGVHGAGDMRYATAQRVSFFIAIVTNGNPKKYKNLSREM